MRHNGESHLVLTAAAVALLALGGGNAWGATFVVDDDGAATAVDCDAGVAASSTTIAGAVALAAAGDTIVVCPGLYAEPVTLDPGKAGLTLRSFDGSAVDGSADTVISPPESTPAGVIINADDATLQGFKIVDPTGVTHGSHEHRMVVVRSDGVRVLANRIDAAGCKKSKTGVLVRGETPVGDGVADGTWIEGNEVMGACIGINSVSVAANRAARSTVIRANNSHDNDWMAVSIDRSPDALVEANTLGPNNGSYSIWCQSRPATQGTWATAAGTVIQGNTVAGNYRGARFVSCADVLVTGNVFSGNTDAGISVVPGTGNSGTPTITGNDLVGNGFGVTNTTAEQVNAACNWWGDASGPSGAGGGSGDSVAAGVTFAPWLLGPTPNGQCVGGTPRGDKMMAMEVVEGQIGSGDDWLDDHLTKAAGFIEKSLRVELWATDSTLTDKGAKVFHEEERAVDELTKVLKKMAKVGGELPPGLNPMAAIDLLIKADRGLATVAREQAKIAACAAQCTLACNLGAPDKDCNKILDEIAKSEEEMTKAGEKYDAGDYDKAIDHYEKSWEHAQKAIKKTF